MSVKEFISAAIEGGWRNDFVWFTVEERSKNYLFNANVTRYNIPMKRLQALAERTALMIGSPISIVLHTIFFLVMFSLPFFGISLQTVLLVLTTIVSLEAIYLSIFVQMTVNSHGEKLSKHLEE